MDKYVVFKDKSFIKSFGEDNSGIEWTYSEDEAKVYNFQSAHITVNMLNDFLNMGVTAKKKLY